MSDVAAPESSGPARSRQMELMMERIASELGAAGTPPPEDPPVDPPPGPDDNDPMEARVTKLEEFAQDTRDRLTRIETRLDQTATKADLSDAMNGMAKWVVGTGVGLGVAGITVMTFVLNNAAPKTQATAAPPAIIINVPSSTQPADPAVAPGK